MKVSFVIPIKKHLVKYLEFDINMIDNKTPNTIYQFFLHNYINFRPDYFMILLHDIFEQITGYYIHENILKDSFRRKTLFKRVNKNSIAPDYVKDFDLQKYKLLKFTLSVKATEKYNYNRHTKKELINKINTSFESSFWRMARNSIYLIRLESNSKDIDKAINIFYKDIKLSNDEYNINSFKIMLYKHGLKSMEKKI